MYENNIATGKVVNDVSTWFSLELYSVMFYSQFVWRILMAFVLKSTGSAMGEYGVKWGSYYSIYIDYSDYSKVIMIIENRCFTENTKAKYKKRKY